MAKLLAKHLKMTITNNTMNKEPKEVDWSKQKPGTIGVTRGRAKRVEFIAARDNEAVFYSSSQGFIQRKINGLSGMGWNASTTSYSLGSPASLRGTILTG